MGRAAYEGLHLRRFHLDDMARKMSRIQLWHEDTHEYPVEYTADKKTRKNAHVRATKHVRQGALQQGRVQPERGGDHTANHREQASWIEATPIPVRSPNAGERTQPGLCARFPNLWFSCG
jgi:hypothetical protein